MSGKVWTINDYREMLEIQIEAMNQHDRANAVKIARKDAEIARLRAAGLAIVTELETIAHTDEYKCPGCNRVFTWQDHGADCPTRVFTEGAE